jgi:hypothetical protein
MVITITIDATQVGDMFGNLAKIEDNLCETGYSFAKVVNNSIKRQFLIQQKKAPRQHMADRMVAERMTKHKSTIFIPKSAYHLDTMYPHYVSLKPGMMITRWAEKYYGPDHQKAYKSRVGWVNGRVQKGSFLFVTSDPFIMKGITRVQNRLSIMVEKTIRQTLNIRTAV